MRDDGAVPARHSVVEPLVAPPGATRRTFQFFRGAVGGHGGGWTINGRASDPDRPIADIPLGEAEIWRFVTDVHHPVHVHLDGFQVLRFPDAAARVGWSRPVRRRREGNGGPAPRRDRGRGRAVQRPRRPFVLHCHNLEHEDMAMMATIRTV